MTHGIADRAKLLALARQLRSQAEVNERVLDDESGRQDVLDLAASAHNIIGELIAEASKGGDHAHGAASF